MSKFKKAMPSEFDIEVERDLKKMTRNVMFWTLGLGAVIIGLRILSLVIFKEPRFDKYVCAIVRNHLWWDIAMFVVLGTLTVIFAVQIFSSIKNDKKKKKKKEIEIPLGILGIPYIGCVYSFACFANKRNRRRCP